LSGAPISMKNKEVQGGVGGQGKAKFLSKKDFCRKKTEKRKEGEWTAPGGKTKRTDLPSNGTSFSEKEQREQITCQNEKRKGKSSRFGLGRSSKFVHQKRSGKKRSRIVRGKKRRRLTGGGPESSWGDVDCH